MMTAGYGIGGFALGLSQGIRNGTELVDSAAKRDMMAKQGKLLDIEATEKQKTLDLQNDIENTVKSVTGVPPTRPDATPATAPAPAGAAPATAIAPPPSAAPAPVAQASPVDVGGGIAAPQEQPVAASGGIAAPVAPAPEKPSYKMPDGKAYDGNNFAHQEHLSSLINAKLVAAGKISPFQAAQQELGWAKIKNENAISAATTFQRTRDSEAALKDFNRSGYQLPEGTQFTIEKTELYPGAEKTDNVVVTTPDGKRVDLNSMIRGALDPKDLANLDVTKAYQSAQIKIQIKTQENLAAYQSGMLGVHAENSRITKSHYETLEKIADKNYLMNLDDKQRRDSEMEQAKDFQVYSSLIGLTKLSDEKLALMSPAEKEAYSAKLSQAAGAMALYGMNTLPNGKHVLTPAELIAFSKNPPKPDQITYDETTKLDTAIWNGKKIYFPPAGTAGAPGAPAVPGAGSGAPAPVAGNTPATPGIKLPTGVSAEAAAKVSENRAAADAAVAERKAAADAAGKSRAEAKARVSAERENVSRYTPEVIAALGPDEALATLQKYQSQLTPMQRTLLAKRTRPSQ